MKTMMTEEAFAARYVRPRPGRTLVTGSKVYPGRADRREHYADVVGVDMLPGLGVDVVLDLEDDLSAAGLGTFQHVDCISVLEHSRRPWLLAANLLRVLEPGGSLYVQMPFVWRVHAYPSDYWRFTVEGVRLLFEGVEWQALQYVSGIAKGIPSVRYDGGLYFAKNEVFGFGHKT